MAQRKIPESERIRVLHITGTGRSGSTLIARLIGSMPGAFAAGEMRFLWERGLADGALCGCRRLVRECPVWSGVVHTIEPDGDSRLPAEVDRNLNAVIRMRRAPRWWLRRRPFDARESFVAANVLAAYKAVAAETGAALIVDSSKQPNFAALLATIPELDVSILHLVRDPRAAAWSWQRGTASQGVAGFHEDMDRLSWAKSSFLWLAWNGFTLLRFGRDKSHYLRIKYEDFMDRPTEEAERIAGFVGLDGRSLPFRDSRTADIAATHIIAGNPNRMGAGQVVFTLDRRWESAMGRRDRAKVSAITGPLMRRFGYSWGAK